MRFLGPVGCGELFRFRSADDVLRAFPGHKPANGTPATGGLFLYVANILFRVDEKMASGLVARCAGRPKAVLLAVAGGAA